MPKGVMTASRLGAAPRVAALFAVLMLATLVPARGVGPTTVRVSVSSEGALANGSSIHPSVSGNGRYVAFYSWASNLVPGDTNGVSDIFVHDRLTQTTVRASVSSSGEQASGGIFGGESLAPSISGDGRYVAFLSYATSLVPGKAQGIYVRDLVNGTTSYASGGVTPSISADGRHIAFWTGASDLVPGDTNGAADVFVTDRVTGATTRVSVSSSGAQANGLSAIGPQGGRISADGRFVVFVSTASNLVAGDTNTCLEFLAPGECPDIFVHDRDADADGVFDEPGEISTVRASVSSAGVQGNSLSESPSISADGRYAAFPSDASNLVAGDSNVWTDVFVRDLLAGTTTRVSLTSEGAQGLSYSGEASISGDGRYVSFSTSSLLAPCDSNDKGDVVVHDRLTGATTLVSVSSSGRQANATSGLSSISADGSVVAFESGASNLDPTGTAGLQNTDTNGAADIYVRDGANQPHPLGLVSGGLYRTDAGPATPTLRTAVCNAIWPQGL